MKNVSLKKTIKLIDNSFIYIEDIYSQCRRTPEFIWINDNIIKLTRIKKSVTAGLKKRRELPSEDGEYPRLLSLCKSIIGDGDVAITEDRIKSVFGDFQSSGNYLTVGELFSLRDMLAARCLIGIGDTCRDVSLSFSQENKMSATHIVDMQNSASSAVGRLIKTLYKLDSIDFTSIFEAVSITESEFLLDPAGVYVNCDADTKNMYRRKLAAIAKRSRAGEYETAKRLRSIAERADGRQRHIGYYLMKYTERGAGALYFAVTYGSALVCCLAILAAAYAARNIVLFFAALFTFLPLRAFFARIVSDILSHKTTPDILPRLRIDRVPDNAKTMVVITILLFGGKHDELIFEKLRRYREVLGRENVSFAVLADLPDSDTKTALGDEDILNAAISRISEISRGRDDVYLFTRQRTYSKSEGKFIGKERKRGEQEELIAYLRGEENTLTVHGGRNIKPGEYRYIIALDEDTEITRSDIERMIGTAIHPLNEPVISSRRGYPVVTDGYGVIQPMMTASLKNSYKWNKYLKYMYACEGREAYAFAQFSLYAALTGVGVFCGKGLIDINAYAVTVSGAFPREQILSHDIAEGTRLRCGCLSDITLTDGVPSGFLQHTVRADRWLRGDVQALVLCRRRIRSADGSVYKNPLGVAEKQRLREPVIAAVTPIFRTIALILSLMSGGFGCLLALVASADIIYGFIYGIIAGIGVPRRVYRCGLPDYYSLLYFNLYYSFASLAHAATSAASAWYRAIIRMKITGRGLLEWKTAVAAEGLFRGGAGEYYARTSLSLVLTAVALLCTIAGGAGAPILFVLAVLWGSFPYVMYRMCTNKKEANQVEQPDDESTAQKRLLRRFAADIWNFFEDNVGPHTGWLPPDNIATIPGDRIAMRTSPTNIGMYLLALLSARDFGFIGDTLFFNRLDLTISAIENLPKWHGNLYNWYNLEDMSVMFPSYVSSVDSGNFLTSLVALKNGLIEYGEYYKPLVERIEVIIKETNIAALYDKKRGLFHIGYNGAADRFDDNAYDLYASEMLTTEFYATASGAVPAEHFRTMGRFVFDIDGRISLLSWSGSTFEYFMPSLFLPTGGCDLRSEALALAYECQKAETAEFPGGAKIYGKSESAFFDFDSEMNYGYKAHGCAPLGLSQSLAGEYVFAPYSLFIMLGCDTKAICRTLASLAKTDLYGKYGFYEAVDFTPKRTGGGHAIVRSYMSHHMGMSIVACANACMNNINVRRFMSEPCCAVGAELLYERIPIGMKRTTRVVYVSGAEETISALMQKPGVDISADTAVLSNGRTKVIATSDGTVVIYDGEKLISGSPSVLLPDDCVRILLHADDEVYDCLRGISTNGGISKRSFSFDGSQAAYEMELMHRSGIMKTIVKITVAHDKPVATFSLDISGNINEASAAFYFQPILNRERTYLSAPPYSDLFVKSDFDPGTKTAVYRRFSHKRSELCAVAIRAAASDGSSIKSSEFFDHKDDILTPVYGNTAISHIFNIPAVFHSGACVHPACAVRVKLIKESELNKSSAVFVVASAVSADDAHEFCSGYDADAINRATDGAVLFYKNRAALAGADESAVRTAMRTANAIINPRRTIIPSVGDFYTEQMFTRDLLWCHGISGDLPIVCVEMPDTALGGVPLSAMRELLYAKRFLAVSGVRYDLVIVAPGGSVYDSPACAKLFEIFEEAGLMSMHGRPNGVHIINGADLSDAERRVIYAMSRQTPFAPRTDGASDTESPISDREIIKSVSNTGGVDLSDIIIDTRGGGFTRGGFAIDKSSEPELPPWQFAFANAVMGTLLTQYSAGYTWYVNAAESKITQRHTDYVKTLAGERLILRAGGSLYDLCACAARVDYNFGYAVYKGEINSLSYEVRIGLDEKLPVKLISVNAEGGSFNNVEVIYTAAPDSSSLYSAYASQREVLFKPVFGGTGVISSLRAVSGRVLYGFDVTRGYVWASVSADMSANGTLDCAFMLVSAPAASAEMCFSHINSKYRNTNDVIAGLNAAAAHIEELYFSASVDIPKDRRLSHLMNRWLPYQTSVIRMTARTGFSQGGGAYGYRDQLQDSLSALYYNPKLARRHIMRSCAHQYKDGLVQHWWHPLPGRGKTSSDPGVRTRCSDDYIWLVYVASHYVMATGDTSLFDVKVPFIESPPLKAGEYDRYEVPTVSKSKASVFTHCMTAIEASIARGEHGLPLIGSGDWNDGMNRVGVGGTGESVWLAFFLAVTLREFANATDLWGKADKELLCALRDEADRLVAAAESAWCTDRYARAYTDDGNVIGCEGSPGCEIDTLPQSFAVFAKADDDRTEQALNTAYNTLFDKDAGVYRLFLPSFNESSPDYGYITEYPEGIRENGGQYTHAAIWAAAAHMMRGDYERGLSILRAINPAIICAEGERGRIYGNEPYIFTADVYYAPGAIGRGGWSSYTGSAGWYYTVVMENLLGISLSLGNVVVSPPPPDVIGDYLVSLPTRAGRVDIAVRYEGTTQATNAPARSGRNYTIRPGESVTLIPEEAAGGWTIINVKN
jgi:cyclic beta-1,2-glucan synthetase